MRTTPTLKGHERDRWAVEANLHRTTLDRYLRTGIARPSTKALVQLAAERLGLTEHLPTPSHNRNESEGFSPAA